jgi:hypothetical protein
MSDYSDLAQINVLYEQSRQVGQAIGYLDAGGTPGLMTIGPPLVDEPGLPPDRGMAVTIPMHGPFTPEFIADLRQKLVDREVDLATQLSDLGVTATPPSHARS